MSLTDTSTIVAPATAPGRAGVAVIRLSGCCARTIAKTIVKKTTRPRMADYVRFYDADGSIIDSGLCLAFHAPASYTGEDVIEFHTHGGVAIVQALVDRCIQLGADMAQPGAFTQRAFLNGKLDLFQAEAVASLIDAESIAVAKSAARSLHGTFSSSIENAAKELTSLRVLVEANLDFSEEAIDAVYTNQLTERLTSLLSGLTALCAGAEVGQKLQEGVQVVLTGPTNAGKSSLFNALCGTDAAIVTDEAGTTRDVIQQSVRFHVQGRHIALMDTAGFRQATNKVEQAGIMRSKQRVDACDWVVVLLDAVTYREGDFERFVHKELNINALSGNMLLILNKIDAAPNVQSKELDAHKNGVYLSAKTGEGIDTLSSILHQLTHVDAAVHGSVFAARRRHVLALQEAIEAVTLAQAMLQDTNHLELIAEHLRIANVALGKITGAFTTEDLLGEIFGAFCIGK